MYLTVYFTEQSSYCNADNAHRLPGEAAHQLMSAEN